MCRESCAYIDLSKCFLKEIMPSAGGNFLLPFTCFLFAAYCKIHNVFSRLVKQNGTVNLALQYIDKRISLEKTIVGFLAERPKAKQRMEFEIQISPKSYIQNSKASARALFWLAGTWFESQLITQRLVSIVFSSKPSHSRQSLS